MYNYGMVPHQVGAGGGMQPSMQPPGMPQGLSALAAQGRGGDTMLMHVNPQEVGQISSLLGTRPTINPATGLPEAFSWKSLLPMLAQIGVSFIPGIGPIAAALIGAGISGTATGLQSGSLGRGLLSGATSLALGSAMGKLAGAAGAGSKAGSALSNAAEYGAEGAATQVANSAAQRGGLAGLQAVGRGLTNTAALKSAALPGMLGLAGMSALNSEFEADKLPQYDPNNPWRMPLTAIQPPGQYFKDRMQAWQKAGMYPAEFLQDDEHRMRLGYRRGGMVHGPGTGRSDSVPAMLSKGEFVMPADVVNRVGARQLYNLIARARRPGPKLR